MRGSSRPEEFKCVHTLDAAACHPCMHCAVLPDDAMLLACVGTAAPGVCIRWHGVPRVKRRVPTKQPPFQQEALAFRPWTRRQVDDSC